MHTDSFLLTHLYVFYTCAYLYKKPNETNLIFAAIRPNWISIQRWVDVVLYSKFNGNSNKVCWIQVYYENFSLRNQGMEKVITHMHTIENVISSYNKCTSSARWWCCCWWWEWWRQWWTTQYYTELISAFNFHIYTTHAWCNSHSLGWHRKKTYFH